jgi:DNA-binding winged helix-turn-helix (wHTH) protein
VRVGGNIAVLLNHWLQRAMSIFRFGPFEVRTRTRELYRSGTKIRLRGQPFQLLQALLNHPGEILTREQMRAELWPSDTFVDFEHGINASLRKLRIALGDSAAKPLYIETLPGEGYRFIAPFDRIEETVVDGNATNVDETQVDDEENEQNDELEPAPVPLRRRWIAFAVAAGIVVCFGFFLFAGKRLWGVHGAPANPADGQVAASNLPERTGDSPLPDPGSEASSSPTGSAESWIYGKVWVVSVAEASNVSFPPPNRIPDATFTTRGIAYIGFAPDNCYTLISFLSECSNRAFALKFSKLDNPNLGGVPADPATPMSGRTWGILIEFTGTAKFTNGQEISILHDDGVALRIDGQQIPGFDPLVTSPVQESTRFAGKSGKHSFDLLYANAAGAGAWLLFYPAMY